MNLNKIKYYILLLLLTGFSIQLKAEKILIPMDLSQTDHLKAYGIAYWTLKKEQTVDWLLNYRGGSFMTEYNSLIANECNIRGVLFEVIDEAHASQIYS
ncbi:asparagine synthetase B, partial [Bacteroidetes/Chlorobi group bacterium ChocPot_Mid]